MPPEAQSLFRPEISLNEMNLHERGSKKRRKNTGRFSEGQ